EHVEAADLVLVHRLGERVELGRVGAHVVGAERRHEELPDLFVERHPFQCRRDPALGLGVELPAASFRLTASSCRLPASGDENAEQDAGQRAEVHRANRIAAARSRPCRNRPPPSALHPPYNSAVSVAEHRKEAVTGVRCAVLTISDTRKLETDVSGRTIVELLEGAGHVVAKRQILRDDPKDVRAAVLGQLGGVDAIVTTGGTGITSRDSTYEAIAGLLEKRLDGFGE